MILKGSLSGVSNPQLSIRRRDTQTTSENEPSRACYTGLASYKYNIWIPFYIPASGTTPSPADDVVVGGSLSILLSRSNYQGFVLG